MRDLLPILLTGLVAYQFGKRRCIRDRCCGLDDGWGRGRWDDCGCRRDGWDDRCGCRRSIGCGERFFW